MIGQIYASGPWLQGGGGSSLPYLSTNNNPMQGVLRIANGQLQALDGTNWFTISTGAAQIDTTTETKEVLMWALGKMQEEKRLEELAKTNPTVADSMQTYKDAEAKLKMVLVLAEQSK
jgi:hypothetical protein